MKQEISKTNRYSKMSDEEVKKAIMKIANSSLTNKIFRQRVVDELEYPFGKRTIHIRNIKGYGATIDVLSPKGKFLAVC